jgi:flagellum-specific peptidoglycan hydrolase FlgJ
VRIANYRTFRRQRLKELDNITKGYSLSDDFEFESMCNDYLSGSVNISEFDDYLNKSLMLNINESQITNNFDEFGNLINLDLLNEGWFGEFLDTVKDKVKSTYNISVSFFTKVAEKIKSFINNIVTKISSGADKVGDLIMSLTKKVMSGLKMFKKFLIKHKKGFYSAIIKLLTSCGITYAVSSIVSYFGPGWVAVSASKVAASEADKKLDISGKISKTATGATASTYGDFQKFQQEQKSKEELEKEKKEEEESKKKPGFFSKVGAKLVQVYQFFSKFRIAGLIFLGTIWIIGKIFTPLHNMFQPIYNITKMTNFYDIFKKEFIVNLSSVPEVKPIGTTKVEVKKFTMPNVEDESGLGVNDVNSDCSSQLNTISQTAQKSASSHSKEFIEEMSKIANELKSKSVGESGLSKVNLDIAEDLSEEQIEVTTDAEVDKLAKTDVAGSSDLLDKEG